MQKQYYVYILTNKPLGTLYTGVTSHLIKRALQHKGGFAEGFSKQHGLKTLVWYEVHEDVMAATTREKQIKMAARLESKPDPSNEPGMA
jgi:putative endonuclease